MPVLKHARKKLRQDKLRTLKNKKVRDLYKGFVKAAKANPTEKTLASAFSSIDKAAKHNILHENKAARLKASLSKLTSDKSEGKTTPSQSEKKAVKKPAKKAATKKATKKAAK
jgi:small subunit ribosomal protein S20